MQNRTNYAVATVRGGCDIAGPTRARENDRTATTAAGARPVPVPRFEGPLFDRLQCLLDRLDQPIGRERLVQERDATGFGCRRLYRALNRPAHEYDRKR